MSTTTLAPASAGFRPESEETHPHAAQCPSPWSGAALAAAGETAPVQPVGTRATQTACATATVGPTGVARATEIPGEQMARATPERAAHREPEPGTNPNGDKSALAPLNWDDPDLGASTAEYAVIVLAAAAFGGVMAAVLSSDSVSGMLLGIIQKALSF